MTRREPKHLTFLTNPLRENTIKELIRRMIEVSEFDKTLFDTMIANEKVAVVYLETEVELNLVLSNLPPWAAL